MGFAPAWPPSVAAGSSPDAAPGVVSACPLDPMTPQLGRIKKRSDFLRAARSGRKWAAAGLVLQACERAATAARDEEAAAMRVGFTASRKVGNAVARNRARRRLKALSQELLPLRGRPGRDYVLIARAETLRRPYAQLLSDLRTALGRVDGNRGKVDRRRAKPAGMRP